MSGSVRLANARCFLIKFEVKNVKSMGYVRKADEWNSW